ncbi:hypothetical protein niasHT_017927 [Heterodera trifolii]|uniref:Replication factor A C-terminal domain-containing protein n=1 Tax=Heterodera trifolii TaxID=157864 RepID=A0ABD2LIQ6_9BILA
MAHLTTTLEPPTTSAKLNIDDKQSNLQPPPPSSTSTTSNQQQTSRANKRQPPADSGETLLFAAKLKNERTETLPTHIFIQQTTRRRISLPSKTVGRSREVQRAGIFFVRANVADLQFSLYKACPLKVNGVMCRKKLDDEMYCRGCAHRANNPLQCLFLRVGLQDCDEPEICQKATVFSSVAEGYLTMRAEQFADMVEKCPEELEALLKSKLGRIVTVKLNLKEKVGEFSTMDWVVVAILEKKEKEQCEADKEDGEVIEIDNTVNKRGAKKN